MLFPDLENVFFGKIHWAHPFRGRQGQEAILRLWRPNFGFHLFFMSFHLEFSLFWVSRLFDLSNLGNLKKKLHLWNQCLPMKMRYVTAFLSKFSLNLSTEEGWLGLDLICFQCGISARESRVLAVSYGGRVHGMVILDPEPDAVLRNLLPIFTRLPPPALQVMKFKICSKISLRIGQTKPRMGW